MTNAVKGFCRWSFETFPEVARLEAGVFEGNDASMAILKRVGFVMEGVKRSAIFKHGVLLDRHDFGLLRDDTKDSK